jgi:hypothetical protein
MPLSLLSRVSHFPPSPLYVFPSTLSFPTFIPSMTPPLYSFPSSVTCGVKSPSAAVPEHVDRCASASAPPASVHHPGRTAGPIWVPFFPLLATVPLVVHEPGAAASPVLIHYSGRAGLWGLEVHRFVQSCQKTKQCQRKSRGGGETH